MVNFIVGLCTLVFTFNDGTEGRKSLELSALSSLDEEILFRELDKLPTVGFP